MRQAALLFVLCFTASCGGQQRLYFPDRINTPGLTKAGSLTGFAGVKPHSTENHTDNSAAASFAADLSVSPVRHLGLMVSYRGLNDRRLTDERFPGTPGVDTNTVRANYSGHRWEGGAGFYETFGRMGRLELYAGFGQGTLRRQAPYSYSLNNFRSRYSRYFLQPAAGAGNDRFSVMGGFRLTMQRITEFDSPLNPDLRYSFVRSGSRIDVLHADLGLAEPFINAEVGHKYVFACVQLGTAFRLFGPAISADVPLLFAVGLSFRLDSGLLPR